MTPKSAHEQAIEGAARAYLMEMALKVETCGCPAWRRSHENAEAFVEDMLPFQIETIKEYVEPYLAARARIDGGKITS